MKNKNRFTLKHKMLIISLLLILMISSSTFGGDQEDVVVFTKATAVYTMETDKMLYPGDVMYIYISVEETDQNNLINLYNVVGENEYVLISPPYEELVKIKLNNGAYAYLESIEQHEYENFNTYLKFKYTVESGKGIPSLDLIQDRGDFEVSSIIVEDSYYLADTIGILLGWGSLSSGIAPMNIMYFDTNYHYDGGEVYNSEYYDGWSGLNMQLTESNIEILDGEVCVQDCTPKSSTPPEPPVDITIPDNLTGEDFKEKVNECLEDLIGELEDESSEELMDLSLDLLENMGDSLDNNELSDEEIENLLKLTDQVEKTIADKNNNDFRLKYTTRYLNRVGALVDNFEEGSDFSKKLRDSAREFSDGVVKTEESTFNEILKERLDDYQNEFEKIENSLNRVLGERDVRPLKPEITLTFVRDEKVKEIKTVIHKEVIKAIGDAGVGRVGFEQNNVKVSFEVDEMLKAKEKFEVKMKYEKDNLGILPEGSEGVGKKLVSDVNAYVDDVIKHTFNRPLNITFNLKELGLDLTPEEKKRLLVVHRLNEETGEWEPVGGRYDPLTDQITTVRFGLSKYTVLKTDKHFSDVENSWAKDEINELLGKGVLDNKNTFNPDEKVTRAEFTAWVVRSYNLGETDENKEFSDVDKDNPYYEEIKLAYENGIVLGMGDGTFAPDKEMTREEMGTLIASALTKQNEKK